MSLLDKIRQEANSPTVKVPPRDDLLAPQREVKEPSATVSDAAFGEVVSSPEVSVQQGIEPEMLSLEAELATYPLVSPKKVGVRLEVELLEAIQDLCRKNDITVETLLESFYTNCKGNDSLMRRVIKGAQARIESRTRAGNIRSILTKSKNIRAQKL